MRIKVFSIVIENTDTTTDDINYVFDYRSSKIDDLSNVGDWFLKNASVEKTTHSYGCYYGDARYEVNQKPEKYSQLAMSFSAERHARPYMLKSFIPLMLIVLVVTLIFLLIHQE